MEAADTVRRALREVAPEADLTMLAPDVDLRETLDLDSLDFLQFVELLAGRTGMRIDEDDYPELVTLASASRFLVERQSAGTGGRTDPG
jgi:acyl carrier protein